MTAKQQDRLQQTGFWILLILVFFMDEYWYDDAHLALFSAITLVFWIAVGVYFNMFVLAPRLFDHRRYIAYLISVFATTIICSGIDYITTTYYYEGFEEESSMSYYIMSSMPYYILIISLTTYYRNVQRQLEEKQLQTEISNQKLEAELNFLKAQVNPHFLFNTLNNIYAFAFMGHTDTAPMIAKLAEILRYMIYDCTAPLVPLEKEMVNLQNLVDLYQMKNSKQQNIQLTYPQLSSKLQVAPLLLISLLENAFKHGDALTNPDGFVRAKAKVVGESLLLFSIENSFRMKENVPTANFGVGMENINRQLALLYPNKHQLKVSQEERTFRVNLQLQLEHKN